MDANSGLPPEIMVLCTTSETKEQAVRLLEWIRSMPDIRPELAWGPAMPAICALLASEQLGNTVVTERRAQQWSQSTPDDFKIIMGEVQRLLVAPRTPSESPKRLLTLRLLVDAFCIDQNALPQMLNVEETFQKAKGSQRWQSESDLVQAGIFCWTCRWFRIPTVKPVESVLQDYSIPAPDFRTLQDFLDAHCFAIASHSVTAPYISSPSNPGSRRLTGSRSPSPAVTPSEGTSTSSNSVRLRELAHEFGVGEDATGGMRFLEKTVRENDELKHLVDWDSTMGRCVIFYWTCSVLKIPSAKHKTLRTQYNLAKKEFDKILSALDMQRAELRKKLETFYAGNPALQLLPRGTQWPATSPAKPQYVPASAAAAPEKSASPARPSPKKGTGRRRGRPPKPRSPPPVPVDPVSVQEEALLSLCNGPGPALQRALVLLRSFNARQQASAADCVPPQSLPAMVALVASQQLGNGEMNVPKAFQASHLTVEEFETTLAAVRQAIDSFRSRREFVRQTTFDRVALEHGLGIDAIMSMMHVREALKDSRCLSTGMDWESPLVQCSVFFWTCAILKVPDVKQSLLRSRSLASKREFDSMLQLLNSHCTTIRHQLEHDAAAGVFFFAPPPSDPHGAAAPQVISLGEEQEAKPEGQDGRPAKRMKREATTPSDFSSDLIDGPRPRPRRNTGRRKPSQHAEDSGCGRAHSPESVYRPTMPFPPADWTPPESLTNGADTNGTAASGCPSSESGESKRRHTRYQTLDYEDAMAGRVEAWKPEGDAVAQQLGLYRQWETRMALRYGADWERDIRRVETGTPFE